MFYYNIKAYSTAQQEFLLSFTLSYQEVLPLLRYKLLTSTPQSHHSNSLMLFLSPKNSKPDYFGCILIYPRLSLSLPEFHCFLLYSQNFY